MDRIIEPDGLQLEFGRAIPYLTLASSSPNRRSLLEKCGTKLRIYIPDIDESKIGATPEEKIRNIAKRKLDAYLGSNEFREDEAAISADTLVLFEGELVGKLKSREEARAFLKRMSGKHHEVLTACGLYIPGNEPEVFVDRADVFFRSLSGAEVESYLESDEWIGAAGAYRLQKTGYKITERIRGDWTTVVGLPLKEILRRVTSKAPHNAQSQV